jgi:hypothetical protein
MGLFDKFLDTLQESCHRCAVHQSMVKGEAEGQHLIQVILLLL